MTESRPLSIDVTYADGRVETYPLRPEDELLSAGCKCRRVGIIVDPDCPLGMKHLA